MGRRARIHLPPGLAAQLARDRLRLAEKEQAKQARKLERKRAARFAPRIELLGSTPNAEWLASVGTAQAELRTALLCLTRAMTAVDRSAGVVSRRGIQAALALLLETQRAIRALQPCTICPLCRAVDPACQTCLGLGVLNAEEAANIDPALLHDE